MVYVWHDEDDGLSAVRTAEGLEDARGTPRVQRSRAPAGSAVAICRRRVSACTPPPALPCSGSLHCGERGRRARRIRAPMIVVDTGGLYAALDANEELHGRAVASLAAAKPPRVISPFVLAELDYLLA